MFNGDYCFSADELPALRSDDDTQINISWIDKFKFIIMTDYQRKIGERTHNPSAFFEYRITEEYSEFEEILKKYQIFTHLDNDCHKTFRQELSYNCLIYAIASKISDQDTLAKMSNYFINISHIPTNMLTDFCKTFDINIVLYSYDNKGHIKKSNKKNGGIFGEKNAKITFELATFKNHYFLYENVPVSRYYLKNREQIKEYGVKYNWSLEKCWKVNKKSGNYFKVDINTSHSTSMSSLEFIKTLYEIGAFTPLYRNDLDVDVAKVHHYVHNKQDVQNLVFSDTNVKLIKEKEKKKKQDVNEFY